ncbi:MAG: hypothetical protein KGH89_01035 [Thaumarchaeota archaeon]|nr:hypothetical protein [Nitrososphaerota archaeon]
MISAIGLIILPLLNSAGATSDLSTLGKPDVTISPISGPPGTPITITVSNIPDISKESYPYPDLYIYLPFSDSFGTTPQSQCGGQDCFPIYTHYDALNHDFADRTVTFTLFSTSNPNPVYLNGLENSVCDVVVNGKTVERYSTLCNAKDQPTGIYNIRFGWGEENAPQINDITQTIQFTVTPGSPPPPLQVADIGNPIIQAYQNGQISQSEFYSKLSALGWNQDEIRQAMAVIGKLPHQMGAPVPDEMQQIQQGVQKAAEQTSQPTEQTTQPVIPQTNPVTIQTQPSSQIQTGSSQALNNGMWTMVLVASCLAATAMGAGLFVIKSTRKITN